MMDEITRLKRLLYCALMRRKSEEKSNYDRVLTWVLEYDPEFQEMILRKMKDITSK